MTEGEGSGSEVREGGGSEGGSGSEVREGSDEGREEGVK